ncbi:RNA polymerase sigma-70 factor (ECF subfamily) [Allocatelliglobosispora scoriae]|uniref:RNA polymerase sigma-70 factor (ECF subfamily) n=1 Tax=Allocatelliglobosispora scoriae TaxID=643052 RepID=A0A841BFU0_9ACTN|nr:RNA polymerase sigma factor [Allocatelliglobosispora scoriae]MBB5867154.1 RNA polymerase sigma-70 factor (ECF subfamily) [Allocatelliglobosispora scoriae]
MDPGFRARVRVGDTDAFRTLFREHSRAVYNHCFRLLGDWSVAEDCVSLVYLEAWRLRAKIDADGGTLLPWLLGIATHVLHRRHRVSRRHRAVLARMPPPAVVPDFADEVIGRLADAERVAAVGAVLRHLPRGDREVLALCVWAGLDYAAAAEALGVPVGTVRSRLSRARVRLARLAEKSPVDREPGFDELAVTDWPHTRGPALREELR